MNYPIDDLPRCLTLGVSFTQHPDEVQWLRTPSNQSTRSPQKPNLENVGINHVESGNYYYQRDHKRQVKPIFRIGNTADTPLLVASMGTEETKDKDGKVVTVEVTVQNPPSINDYKSVKVGKAFEWSQSN